MIQRCCCSSWIAVRKLKTTSMTKPRFTNQLAMSRPVCWFGSKGLSDLNDALKPTLLMNASSKGVTSMTKTMRNMVKMSQLRRQSSRGFMISRDDAMWRGKTLTRNSSPSSSSSSLSSSLTASSSSRDLRDVSCFVRNLGLRRLLTMPVTLSNRPGSSGLFAAARADDTCFMRPRRAPPKKFSSGDDAASSNARKLVSSPPQVTAATSSSSSSSCS
mmetsp:Transcript_18233/g.59600  ORF Transcript_18233/g.59600 Transcript_18233/m.59600 type:complete len:216 (-) Transcript_18233:537-1184(-)